MFELPDLLTFLAASVVIILAPGPAQMLVIARSINEGTKAGMMTGIGLNIGTIVHAIAAAMGLSAILATSATIFGVIKFLGAGYLVYLGIQALRGETRLDDQTQNGTTDPWSAFRKAIITGILNPKVAIFFLAFLPQFVNPARGMLFLQFLILGLILAVLDICYESALALIAGRLNNRFMRNPRIALWRQRATGIVLVGLGLRLAFMKRD